MKDTFDTATCPGHFCGIVYIGFNKVHRLQPEQILTLSGDKIVDTTDFLASRYKFGGNRPAYEASCARN